MTQPVDIEALRALMERATPGPWAYRPQEHDDWGFIRTTRATEDGWHPVVARANDVSVHEDHDAHRAAKTDPAEGNARLIVAAVNALPSLLTELEALRAERGRMVEGLQDARAGFEASQVLISALSNGHPSVMIETFIERIDATLSALKTPTPDMVEAGQEVDGTITAEEVWSAMIRKAKEG